MPDSKSISQLTTAENTTANDLFEVAMANGQLGYLSRKVTLKEIADFVATEQQYSSDLQTTIKTIVGAINEIRLLARGVVLTDTLDAGDTSIVFTDNAIVSTSIIDWYIDDDFYGVVPTNISVDPVNHSITFTFEAQEDDIPIKVVIK